MARLSLELLLYGGPRASDASNLDLRHIRKVGRKMIVYEQKKNRHKNPVTAFIPIVPALQAMLDVTPRPDGVTAIVFNQWGNAFTEKGFSNRVKKWFTEAGLPHCNSHGMRKACVVRMIMDNHTPFEIMAVTGHRTMKEIERYGRHYLRERASRLSLTSGSRSMALLERRMKPGRRNSRSCSKARRTRSTTTSSNRSSSCLLPHDSNWMIVGFLKPPYGAAFSYVMRNARTISDAWNWMWGERKGDRKFPTQVPDPTKVGNFLEPNP